MSPSSKIWVWLQRGHSHFLTLYLEYPLLKCLEINPVLDTYIFAVHVCFSKNTINLPQPQFSPLCPKFNSNSIRVKCRRGGSGMAIGWGLGAVAPQNFADPPSAPKFLCTVSTFSLSMTSSCSFYSKCDRCCQSKFFDRAHCRHLYSTNPSPQHFFWRHHDS